MDSHRFDKLTKAIAEQRTRRRLLQGALVAAGGVLATSRVGRSLAEGECEVGLDLCGTDCVDLMTSEVNCGVCDAVCASGTCVDGSCTEADAVPTDETTPEPTADETTPEPPSAETTVEPTTDAAAPTAEATASTNGSPAANGDLDLLNYALSLEHLEHAFYRDGLKRFDAAAFKAAKQPDGLLQELGSIRDHERDHVALLTKAISGAGGTPVAEGVYDFGYTDAESFLKVAMTLENTGVAAYAGAAPKITDSAILAVALGILSVEARHAAYLNLRNSTSGFPVAVDVALTQEKVLKAIAPFVKK